jgi:CheY-like chemotaxis protein
MKGQSQVDFSGNRIIVADDHPVNLFFACKLLAKLGFHTVDTAENGKTALAMIARNSYDLIILDCQMPEMDGCEVSRIIRQAEQGTGEHVPIVAMTAMAENREKCLAAGMDDYVTKPINDNRMVDVLIKWLKNAPIQRTAMSPARMSAVKQLEPLAYGPPVDMERLGEYISDEDEKSMIVGVFFGVSEEAITAMEDGATEGDNEKWRRAAHKLKGSAANFGANYLKECCLQAEQLSEANAVDKVQLLYMVRQAYDSVRAFLAV